MHDASVELPLQFERFLSNISVDQPKLNRIISAHSVLRKALERDDYVGPALLETFLQGSYVHGTAIRPLGRSTEFDVDVCCLLDLPEVSIQTEVSRAVPEKYRTGWRLLGGDDASLMPHRQPAGQSLQDLHSRPGITGTFPLWQQLQGMQLESHRVVPGHFSAVLDVVGLRLCHLLTGQRKCHPMRDLTLNQQEQTRIQVLNSVLEYGCKGRSNNGPVRRGRALRSGA